MYQPFFVVILFFCALCSLATKASVLFFTCMMQMSHFPMRKLKPTEINVCCCLEEFNWPNLADLGNSEFPSLWKKVCDWHFAPFLN